MYKYTCTFTKKGNKEWKCETCMYIYTDIRLHRIRKSKKVHVHMRTHKTIEKFVF